MCSHPLEHFRQHVAAAHLRPLEKGEDITALVGERDGNCWNTAVSKETIASGDFAIPDPSAVAAAAATAAVKASLSTTCKSTRTPLSTAGIKTPTSASAFDRDWRRTYQTVELRLAYLRCLPLERIESYLSLPSSVDILGDVISLIPEAKMSDKDINCVLHLLYHLGRLKRFPLALMFLSEPQRDTVAELTASRQSHPLAVAIQKAFEES